MKRLLLILGFVMLSAASVFAQNGTIPLSRGANKVECVNTQLEKFGVFISFNSINSQLIDTPEGRFSSIYVDGAYNSGDLGSPQLPSFHKLIYVPEGATPRVVVNGYTTSEYKLADYDITTIYPAQRSYSKSEKPENMKFEYNEQAYLSSKSRESQLAFVDYLGSMREMGIGKLYVNPVKYNYEEGTITVYNNIDIDVVFDNANIETSKSRLEKSYSPYFSDLYKRMFNGSVINKSKPGDLLKYPVSMLVISNRMFEEALQPWLQWKRMKGFNVEVSYTDEIGTTANDIKIYCADKYNECMEEGSDVPPPSFLVLIGDVAQVVPSANGTYPHDKKTDLYYGSVDGDAYPEMFYSRISVTSPTELTNYIDKLIYYEKYNFEDPAYLDNVTLLAGWDTEYNKKFGQPTVSYWLQNYFNSEHGFDHVNSWLGKPYTNCYSNINTGIGLINYTAHGWMDSWSDPMFDVKSVHNLNNVNKYPIAIGNCCLSADFSYGECFGEAWIRAAKKGAVGYIGSAPNSYWSEDLYWSVGACPNSGNGVTPTVEGSGVGVYDAVFSDTFTTLCGMVTVGNMAVDEAISRGYRVSVGSLYYWQAYNVLGDGSLSPYIRQGKDNPIEHANDIYIGLDSFEITGAIPGSYATISRDGVVAGVALANEDGVAVVKYINGTDEIRPGSAYDLVVTRAGFKPCFAKLEPKSLDAPYILVNQCEVDNEYNALINGEEETLTLMLENLGNVATVDEVSISLSCDDELLTFLDSKETYPVIASKQTSVIPSGFRVKVASETENGHVFVVNFVATSGTDSWTGKFSLKLIAPILQYVGYSVSEGSLTKGSVCNMVVEIENSGEFVAEEVELMLISDSEYLLVLEKEAIKIGDINEHANADATLKVYVKPNLPIGHTVNFTVSINSKTQPVVNEGFAISWTEYCIPEKTECINDKIVDVIFAGISNLGTACSTDSYGDYTSIVGTVEAAKKYTFTTKAGYANDRVCAWIDYDENGLFEESELIVSNLLCVNKANQYSVDVTIPNDVLPGSKRMRVRSFWSQADIIPDPCVKVTQYGETEDYTVVVATPYIEPSEMVVIKNQEKEIVISWSAPLNATPDGYKLYRNDILITSESIEATTFVDEPELSDFYIYKVTAVYGENESIPIYGFIDYEGPNSVKDVKELVDIYPNPANTIINVSVKDIQAINIFDMAGRLIKSSEVNDSRAAINVSALNQGVYLMVIKTMNSTIRKNIIIKH